ncbi:MAG: O-antigen ligase family protein [Sedimentisphaerales bacterium]|nr:O-antigen ligase family protein [Sedimentisphaerales bacterium]
MIIRESNISTAVTQQPAVLGWRLPAAGFFVYSVIAIGALIVDARGFLVIGGALLFMCVCIEWCRNIMAVRVDKSVLLVFCIMFLSIFTTLYDPTNTIFHFLLKHIVICILYIFIFSMGLAPIYSTPFRTVFIFVLLFMGLVSFFVPNVSETDDVMRMSGIFVNANMFSLSMMTLLFLIDEEKDSRARKFSIHAILVLFLLLSGTSGAILAYAGAMAFKYLLLMKSTRRYRNKWVLLPVGIALLLLGCLLTTRLLMDVPIVKRIVTQLYMVWHELPLAASGYELDYGYLNKIYSTNDCSGIWRISHWRTCVDVVADANIVQLLCGRGIASSTLLLYNEPHNDYLRVLIEQGIIGLTLYMAFFLTMFRRIDSRHWYCIVMIALYCFSENNLENLLFMSLFVFFLASAQKKTTMQPATAPR